MDRRDFVVGVAAATSGAWSTQALAADSLLKLVYPYTPGSGGDILARVLADDLQKKLGLSAIVENRPGAAGRIGVRDVAHAEPDGNTLLFTPFGTMVLFPTVYKHLPYDAFKDFRPVTQVVTYDFGLAAGPVSGARTLAELTEWLKKNPDKGNFSVPGLGALPHLLPLKYAADAGVKLNVVAYKGTAPALTAAMSGETALVCTPLADLIAQHKAGAIHVLAVSGKQRSPYLPDVPTFEEQGFKIQGSGWYGIFAPAKTPDAVVEKLNKILTDAIHSESFQQRARSVFLNPTGTTMAELGQIQKEDYERWAPVIRASGLDGK